MLEALYEKLKCCIYVCCFYVAILIRYLYVGYGIPSYLSEIVSELDVDIDASDYGRGTSSNVKNCGNEGECYGNTIDTSDTNRSYYGGPICCTAAHACEHGNLSTQLNFDNNLINAVPTAVRCDGYWSCANTTIESMNGGHVYSTGQSSCYYCEINGVTRKYNAFCTAAESCVGAEIYNFGNLLCTGESSCKMVNGYNISNVYVYANLGADSGSLSNIRDNVYCVSRQSCLSTNINNVITGNVVGIGYQSLYGANISNIFNGSVIGIGFSALRNAEIRNVNDSVIGIGGSVLRSCVIENVANVCLFFFFID